MHAALDDALGRGSAGYGPVFEARAEARACFARLLDCDPAEIALVPNTSTGLHLVADGLDWRPGDEVVVFDRDFPANVHPWLRLTDRGVRIRWVPMCDGGYHLDDVVAAVGPATRLIALSHVNFRTGFRMDLDAVCAVARRVGALVCVDAVQSLGVLPLSVARTPVDFVAAGAHKWLCAPPGTGVLYCRLERLDLLRWAPPGWFGFEGAANMLSEGEGHFSYDLPLRPRASRFEGGMPNLLGLVGLAASLQELEAVGSAAVSARVLGLAAQLRDGLRDLGCTIEGPADSPGDSPTGSDCRSGIVAFVHPAVPGAELYRALTESGCDISFPDGRLRVSPHCWSSDSEIREFLDMVKRSTGSY
jgi:selenocysteine lyase/cysteine desulfurase